MDLRIFRQPTIPLSSLGLSIFVYAILSIPRSRKKATTGIEAGGAWPVIGHLHLLGGPEPPHITVGNMGDKNGPIFTVRFGVHKTLKVNSWEIAKECFTLNDRAFASRPKTRGLRGLGLQRNFGMIGFSPHGAYWRRERKIILSRWSSSPTIG
ncbi:hypothetical protein QN277_017919 [Acacia crassicarpa]|uniref:Cytochrome P450 n=1 Tax=Acacia crassicarpa TaxID=499986 RepID=A0AAE1MUI7_9FABA|nr:hypothetical protein QN277_017919 [Acacia crassicarpa]